MAIVMSERALRDLCAEHGDCYRTPALNDRLYLSNKGFAELGGLAAYTGLRALFADGNALASLRGLPLLAPAPPALPNGGGGEGGNDKEQGGNEVGVDGESKAGGLPLLRCLYVQNNCLTSLEGLYEAGGEGATAADEEAAAAAAAAAAENAPAQSSPPPPLLLRTPCPRLEKLNVSGNRLASLEGVQHLPSLTALEAAGNDLSCLAAALAPLRALGRRQLLLLQKQQQQQRQEQQEQPEQQQEQHAPTDAHPSDSSSSSQQQQQGGDDGDGDGDRGGGGVFLSTLDLSGNALSDPALADAVAAACPRLRVLYLRGNPAVSSTPNYRRRLVAALPCLSYLDDRPVFPEERRLAGAWARGGMAGERAERAKMAAEREAAEAGSLDFMRRLRAADAATRRRMLGVSAAGGVEEEGADEEERGGVEEMMSCDGGGGGCGGGGGEDGGGGGDDDSDDGGEGGGTGAARAGGRAAAAASGDQGGATMGVEAEGGAAGPEGAAAGAPADKEGEEEEGGAAASAPRVAVAAAAADAADDAADDEDNGGSSIALDAQQPSGSPTARALDDARAYFDDLRERRVESALVFSTPLASPAAPMPSLAPPAPLPRWRADDGGGGGGGGGGGAGDDTSAAALSARLRARRVARALDFADADALPASFSALSAGAAGAADKRAGGAGGRGAGAGGGAGAAVSDCGAAADL